MTLTGYRVQDQARDITDLLNPENHVSFHMSGRDEDVRHGVSAVETIYGLAAYIAVSGIDVGGNPLLVKVTGPQSDDTPCDADMQEVLILPTAAEEASEEEAEKFFGMVDELVDLHWEEGLGFADLEDRAYDLFFA